MKTVTLAKTSPATKTNSDLKANVFAATKFALQMRFALMEAAFHRRPLKIYAETRNAAPARHALTTNAAAVTTSVNPVKSAQTINASTKPPLKTKTKSAIRHAAKTKSAIQMEHANRCLQNVTSSVPMEQNASTETANPLQIHAIIPATQV